jgi:asparagine synthase (glutamine-hydrolysing)
LTLDDSVDRLNELMKESVTRMVRRAQTSVLAFSGGIDSSLLAYYMRDALARPQLICVGVEGSPDFEASLRAADELGLSILAKEITVGDVEEKLDAVLRSVEDANPLSVGVAFPLHFVTEEAIDRGVRLVFSGNGSDELFGGYSKYVDEYQAGGEAVRETMYRDVIHSYEVNFERDWKVCSRLGAELRLPYAYQPLVTFGLALPTSHKLPKEGREPRKIILRRLASRLGLSVEVQNRPKKAAQYSTGILKIIEKLAKRSGLTTRDLLAKRFAELGESKN